MVRTPKIFDESSFKETSDYFLGSWLQFGWVKSVTDQQIINDDQRMRNRPLVNLK